MKSTVLHILRAMILRHCPAFICLFMIILLSSCSRKDDLEKNSNVPQSPLASYEVMPATKQIDHKDTMDLRSQLMVAKLRSLALQSFTGYVSQVPGYLSSTVDSLNQIVFLNEESKVMELAITNGLGCSNCTASSPTPPSIHSRVHSIDSEMPAEALGRGSEVPIPAIVSSIPAVAFMDSTNFVVNNANQVEMGVDSLGSILSELHSPIAQRPPSYPQYVLKRIPKGERGAVEYGVGSVPNDGIASFILGFSRDASRISGTRGFLSIGGSGDSVASLLHLEGTVAHLQQIGKGNLLVGGKVNIGTSARFFRQNWDFKALVEEEGENGGVETTRAVQELWYWDGRIQTPVIRPQAMIGLRNSADRNAILLTGGMAIQGTKGDLLRIDPVMGVEGVLSTNSNSRFRFSADVLFRDQQVLPGFTATYQHRLGWKPTQLPFPTL